MLNKLKYSPVWHQLFNVITFILVGKIVFSISVSWFEIITCLIVSIATETFMQFITKQKLNLKPSSFISALSICVMLRSTSPYILPVFSALAIIQKYIFRQKDGRHLFNPSNIAIFLALAIFPYIASLDMAGWPPHIYFIFFILSTGSVLIKRSHLLINTVIYFILMSLIKYTFFPINLNGLMISLLSPAILLFGFFIINDPQSIPQNKKILYAKTFFFSTSTMILILLFGKKSLVMPMSLILSSLIFRWLEIRLPKTTISSTRILISTIILFITTYFIFFFSEYNLRRNFNLSQTPFENESRILEVSRREKISSIDYEHLFNNKSTYWEKENDLTYSKKLKSVHPEKKLTSFKLIKNALSNSQSKSLPKDWSYDYSPYASIGSIDLNQDNLNDLMTSSSTGELEIFINLGSHQYLNVTDNAFTTPPSGVEEFKVIDINGDGFEDILVIFSQYQTKKTNGFYLFNPHNHLFEFMGLPLLGKDKKQAGGISFIDINNDKIFDFYVSFGSDWHNHDFYQPRYLDELWVSNAKTGEWENQYAQYFPQAKALAGMSVLFSRSQDKILLLVGNDFKDDPSLIYRLEKDVFKSLSNQEYPVQSSDSMSLFNIDIDNDGIFEIWENAIQNKNSFKHASLKTFDHDSLHISNRTRELQDLFIQKAKQKFPCHHYTDPFVKHRCNYLLTTEMAKKNQDLKLCYTHVNIADQHRCLIQTHTIHSVSYQRPDLKNNNIEEFARTQTGNTLLKWDQSQKMLKDITIEPIKNTGWAWSSYPFDIDLNGYLDFYISSNFLDMYQGHNHLLMNYSQRNEIKFENETKKHKLNYTGEYRGVLIDDMNNDCQATIMVNNFLDSPLYISSLSQGKCVKFSLRFSMDNFYSVGTIIKLKLSDKSIMTREVQLGGIWGSSQSKTMHFGIPDNLEILSAQIIWPDKSQSLIETLNKNYHYLIFHDKDIAMRHNQIQKMETK